MNVTVMARMTVNEWSSVETAARAGDLAPAREVDDRLATDYAALMTEYARSTKISEREMLQHVMSQTRDLQTELRSRLRAVRDDEHAEAMRALTAASNDIAASAVDSAKALKHWTVVLAWATVVLAVATIALIVVTAVK